MKIVICGFGSAGYAALTSMRRINPGAQIVIIDPKEHDLIHPCGLPYSLEGIVPESDLTQDINLKRMGAEKIRGLVKSIDRKNKRIIYSSEDGEFDVTYDRALISTGYRPLIPPIKGIKDHLNKSLFTLTSINDLKGITDRLEASSCGSVVGAGAIGLETAFAMKDKLDKISVIEMKNQILPGILDPDISKNVEKYVSTSGIELHLNKTAESFSGTPDLYSVKTADIEIKSDIAVLATGFLANTSAAEASDLEVCGNGIVVNKFLQTADPDIFAAGDCISGWSVIDSSELKAKLATSAYKQGSLAGANIASEGTIHPYRGSAGTFVTKFGELEVAGTGFTTDTAKAKGFDVLAGKISTHIQPDYFPDNREITVKVIFDRSSGRILGAQAAGEKGTAERINIISTAIEFNINIHELGRTELAYCPAVSEVYDPLLRAIDFGLRRIKK